MLIPACAQIYVANLPKEITEKMVADLFSQVRAAPGPCLDPRPSLPLVALASQPTAVPEEPRERRECVD